MYRHKVTEYSLKSPLSVLDYSDFENNRGRLIFPFLPANFAFQDFIGHLRNGDCIKIIFILPIQIL